jgi:hypothetical protein
MTISKQSFCVRSDESWSQPYERDEISDVKTAFNKNKYKINFGICIAPTQPFRAALGAESRVCYPGNTADKQTQ